MPRAAVAATSGVKTTTAFQFLADGFCMTVFPVLGGEHPEPMLLARPQIVKLAAA
jgi:hypothetical protein